MALFHDSTNFNHYIADSYWHNPFKVNEGWYLSYNSETDQKCPQLANIYSFRAQLLDVQLKSCHDCLDYTATRWTPITPKLSTKGINRVIFWPKGLHSSSLEPPSVSRSGLYQRTQPRSMATYLLAHLVWQINNSFLMLHLKSTKSRHALIKVFHSKNDTSVQ